MRWPAWFYVVMGTGMLVNGFLCFVRMTVWPSQGDPSWVWIPGTMIGVIGCYLSRVMYAEEKRLHSQD